MSPSRLRGARSGVGPVDGAGALQATLAFREPLARGALLRFLAQRAVPGVEWVDVGALCVRRTVRPGVLGADHDAGWIELGFVADRAQLRLRASESLVPTSGRLLAAVRRWFDLDAEPAAIEACLADLRPPEPGVRLPGGIDAFELAVRAVLGQQVTVAAARTLARRVVERFGGRVETPWAGLDLSFPAPDTIARAGAAALGELGIIRTRAAAIVDLAVAWREIEPLLRPPASPEALVERMRAVRGIGPWTAHYVAMRALGWSDAFPPGDVAVLNALELGRDARAQRCAEARAQQWRPWRAYAVLALWNQLEQRP